MTEEIEPVDDANDFAPEDEGGSFEDPGHFEGDYAQSGTLWSGAFWKGAGERAIKTFIQTFIAVVIAGVGADAVGVTAGILDVSWLSALSVAALAGLLSLGTSIGNVDFTSGR